MSDVLILPSILTVRATMSKICWALALAPAPVISTSPRLTLKPFKDPSAPKPGVPVVRVMRSVLIKPQPLHVIPLGLATTTSARPPKTSVKPASRLRLVDTTSFRITLACWARLALPATCPASCDKRDSWSMLPLFSTSPRASTL